MSDSEHFVRDDVRGFLQMLEQILDVEPAASALTGRRALQTAPQDQVPCFRTGRTGTVCPQGSSNPRYRLERAAS